MYVIIYIYIILSIYTLIIQIRFDGIVVILTTYFFSCRTDMEVVHPTNSYSGFEENQENDEPRVGTRFCCDFTVQSVVATKAVVAPSTKPMKRRRRKCARRRRRVSEDSNMYDVDKDCLNPKSCPVLDYSNISHHESVKKSLDNDTKETTCQASSKRKCLFNENIHVASTLCLQSPFSCPAIPISPSSMMNPCQCLVYSSPKLSPLANKLPVEAIYKQHPPSSVSFCQNNYNQLRNLSNYPKSSSSLLEHLYKNSIKSTANLKSNEYSNHEESLEKDAPKYIKDESLASNDSINTYIPTLVTLLTEPSKDDHRNRQQETSPTANNSERLPGFRTSFLSYYSRISNSERTKSADSSLNYSSNVEKEMEYSSNVEKEMDYSLNVEKELPSKCAPLDGKVSDCTLDFLRAPATVLCQECRTNFVAGEFESTFLLLNAT